jgi:hypothetical protein
MDNAAHHSHKSKLLSTTAWWKNNIKQWLLTENILHVDSLKCKLLQTVANVKSEYTLCVDKTAEQWSRATCRLPLYHCKLSSTELVWSQIKRQVAVGLHNTQFKAFFKNNSKDSSFNAVLDNHWANYCK